MPKALERKRGGVLRYRTIKVKGHPNEYIHIAIVRKEGPRGGRTIAGKIHNEKVRV